MHPQYWHRYYHHVGRRPPSRLFWFVVGAITTAWIIKRKEALHYRVAHCVRYQIPQEAYPPPGLPHAQQQQSTSPEPPPPSTLPTAADPTGPAPTPLPHTPHPHQQDPYSRPWGWGWGYGQNSSWEWGSRSGSETHLPLPADRWEEDRKRMHDIGKHAQETVSFPLFSAASWF